MIRIALVGLQHETNTFVLRPTPLDAFRNPGGWPAMAQGAAVLDTLAGTPVATAGAIEAAADRSDIELVPIFWALALPGGRVEENAFDILREWICDGLREAREAGGLDAVFLELHGAMATQSVDHAETALVESIRGVLGEAMPIAVALDLHANLEPRFIDTVTLIDGYRTYPHVDLFETGVRTMRRLLAFLDGGGPRPATVWRQPGFQIPLTFQCTLTKPAGEVIAAAQSAMAADPDLSVCQCFGFPLSDIPEAGPTVIVAHPDVVRANAVADELMALWTELEPAFDGPQPDAATAVDRAVAALSQASSGPVIVADTQDNPGGGGPGETTGMLRELLRRPVPGGLVVHISDPAAVAAAHEAGIGATVNVTVGGTTHPEFGAPVPGPWTVEALADGPFPGEGPMYRGTAIDLGPVAILSRDGVSVLVAPRKMQASEPGLLRHLGLDPFARRLLVLKSSVHFRGAYADRADTIIVGCAPGPVTADLRALGARRQRRRPAGMHPA